MARRIPPVWFLLLAVIFVYGFLSVAIVKILGMPESFSIPGWIKWIVGGTLIVAGISFLSWAICHLSLRRAFGRELNALPENSSLITTGPYAFVRNPLYLGASVALVGWTIFLQSVVLVFATLCMLIHFYFVAKWEEKELKSRLGEKYDAYRKKTPLFLPGLFQRTHK